MLPPSLEANVTQAVPFFGVIDLARSLEFYVEGLQFRIAARWEPEGRLRWCRLELGGAALMLQEYLHTASRSLRPTDRLGVGVSVSFTCLDALAIHELAQRHGLSPREPFVGNGLWVVGFTDPDGYRIEFASPTDVPEETTLSAWRHREPGTLP